MKQNYLKKCKFKPIFFIILSKNSNIGLFWFVFDLSASSWIIFGEKFTQKLSFICKNV